MPDAIDIWESGRKAYRERFIAPPTKAESSPGLIRRALSLPIDAASKVLDVLDYSGSATRAGLANIFADLPDEQRTGRQTRFGKAPSGRELLGLGTGTKGVFEAADLPGFAAEVLLDPINLLSFGTVSTAGKAAARADKLRRMAKVAEAMGKTEKAAEAAAKLAQIGDVAAPIRRSLVAFDIPGGPKIPIHLTGGRISGAVFDGLGRLAAPAKRLTEPLTRHLRASGRIGSSSFRTGMESQIAEAIGDAPVGLFNEGVKGAREIRAGGVFDARQFGSQTAHTLAGYTKRAGDEPVAALTRMREATEAARAGIAERYDRKIAEALKAGDEAKAGAIAKAKDRALNRVLIPTRENPLDATKALTLLGVEKVGQIEEIEKKIAELTAKHAAAATKGLQEAQDALNAALTPESIRTARDRLAKVELTNRLRVGRLASQIETLTQQADVYRAIREHLPAPIRHEVDRIKAAMGTNFAAEQAAGVKYKSLSDALLGYMPRKMVRGAREEIEKLPADDPFRAFIKEFETSGPFTKERAKQWLGVSIPQINDIWRARGGKGNLFDENVAEIVTRRLVEGAEARAGASMVSGAIRLFALPKEKAGPGAISVAEAIKDMNIGRMLEKNMPFQKAKESSGKYLERIAKALEGTGLEDKFVPAEIVSQMKLVNKTIFDPAEMRGVVRFIEKVNAIYRLGVTQFFPAFHTRNAFSNFFMMGMAGMRDPRYLVRAGKLMLSRDEADRALIREAAEFASLGAGFSAENRALLGGGLADRVMGPVTKIGQTVEDHAKLAMYLWAKDKGRTKQEAGRLVQKWLFDYGDLSHIEKRPFGLRSQAYFYCVPTDCEILTREGWKRHDQLRLGEHVVGYDVERHECRWTAIEDVAVFDYDGELMTLGHNGEGTRGCFPFTPNHRWPILTHSPDGSLKREIVRGYELRTSHKIPRSAPFVDWPKDSPFSEREAAIIGWLITDGTFSNGWAIYQHPKKFAAEIEALLGEDACKRQTHPDTGVYQWTLRATLRNTLKAKGFTGREDAVRVIGQLTEAGARAMWDAMYKADGVTTGDGTAVPSFACTNPVVLDAAQMLVQLLGLHMNRSTKGGYISRTDRTLKVAGALGTMWYKGQVWCPKTGTGTWVMRRNGKIIITGNTYTRKAIPLLMTELVGNPRLFRLYGLATGAVGSRRDVRNLLPPWLTAGTVGTGTDEQGRPTFVNPGLPPENLLELGTEGKGPWRTAQKLAAQLAPFPFRVPFEVLTNFNLRSGRAGLRKNTQVSAALDQLPAGVAAELRPLERLEPLLPTSRASAALAKLASAAGGKASGADVASSLLLGLTPLHIDAHKARIRKDLDTIEAALEKLDAAGLGDSQRARELRTLKGRKRRELQGKS